MEMIIDKINHSLSPFRGLGGLFLKNEK